MRLTIRPMRPRAPTWTPDDGPDDRSFVVESWIASFRHRPPIVSVGDWHGVMSLAVGKIIVEPGVKVLVAADLDAPPGMADLFGWLAYEPQAVDRSYDEVTRKYDYRRVPVDARHRGLEPIVWYCFVKRDYQRNGIARRLFEHAGLDSRGRFHYLCDTRAVAALSAAGKLPRATLRPNLGRLDERTRHAARSEADAA